MRTDPPLPVSELWPSQYDPASRGRAQFSKRWHYPPSRLSGCVPLVVMVRRAIILRETYSRSLKSVPRMCKNV